MTKEQAKPDCAVCLHLDLTSSIQTSWFLVVVCHHCACAMVEAKPKPDYAVCLQCGKTCSIQTLWFSCACVPWLKPNPNLIVLYACILL